MGRVNQALAAAMRELLRDYYVLVAQLEQQMSEVCADVRSETIGLAKS